ncbi:MAG: DUF3298 and DUF4163 domain-containing protein [Crocinitomicaceae bacterium]|nr:DUF3298 and DUF4163 domain-containing protein [Crocinitomicaceae bacterium]
MRKMAYIAYLLIAVAVVASCDSSKNRTMETADLGAEMHKPDSWERGEATAFYVNKSSSDTTKAAIYYTIAKPDSPLKSVTDSIIGVFLGNEVKMPISKESLTAYATGFVNEYKDLVEKGDENMFVWELNVSLNFDTVNANYLKAEFVNYGFTGGAHGNTNLNFYMIDIEKAKLLKLSDICSNIKELEKRAEVYFRKEYVVDSNSDLEEAGFWFDNNKFQLNKNFYFEKDKLVFVYNQYEIAAYSMGQIFLEIPLKDIKDILKINL